ncbi:molybdopterin-dependent oxidoreductase [Candidatus Desulforudis audaxviator]|nr:molybdopterin-dependent oxidoreductase [Candidatus Desulforudis audaxviator]AZK58678.1 NAD-dependent formate dehydrogenase alpha subunit [Candidatus Desulforudis audaxviator]
MEAVEFTINGLPVRVPGKGATILEAALRNGIYIPHLCHHPDLKPAGLCRVCMVEADGKMVAACRTPVADGMKVATGSPNLDQYRRYIVGVILAEHESDCLTCGKNLNCKLQEVARYANLEPTKFKELRPVKPGKPLDDTHPWIVRNHNKCILCGICVRTCREIAQVNAIDFAFRGRATTISTFGNKPLHESNCVSCGECVARCPVGALLPKVSAEPAREAALIPPQVVRECERRPETPPSLFMLKEKGAVAEKITLTIDGLEASVEKGATVLEAAQKAGIYIPFLCFHPELTGSGGCRVCAVEIDGKVVPSCTTRAREGMVVRTSSPQAREAQAAAVKRILAGHNGDCLNCAKNGRCKLQEVVGYTGVYQEMAGTPAPFAEVDESNPYFVLDRSRCVACGICLRTCRQVNGADALEFKRVDNHRVVVPRQGGSLAESACESCGECVARCPVGALLPKELQQPGREVETVCTECGIGCGVYFGARGGRLVSARQNLSHKTSKGRLCGKGRFGWGVLNHPDRLKTPLIKKDGQFVEAGWEEALGLAAGGFSRYKGGGAVVLYSPRVTNEEIYLALKFARAVLGTSNIADAESFASRAGLLDGLGTTVGSNAMTIPVRQIERAAGHFVISSSPTESHPIIGFEIRKSVNKGAKLIIADSREIPLSRLPHIRLALRPSTELALLLGMARAILDEKLHDEGFIRERTTNFDAFQKSLADFTVEKAAEITGVPGAQIREAARVYATSKPALLFWSEEIAQHPTGQDSVRVLAQLALMTGNYGKPGAGFVPLIGRSNFQGALDLDVTHPWSLVSKEKVADAWGCAVPEPAGSAENKAKAWYIIGADPVTKAADADSVRKALSEAPFVVVQDTFLTETAKLAQVVLPTAGFAEKEGTFTAVDRLVQRVRQVAEPPGAAKPDWWIICEIAHRMEAEGFAYNHPSQIMEEISSNYPAYAGISYDRLDPEGLRWPCPDKEHPGTDVLHESEFFGLGKAQFRPLQYKP